MNHNNTSTKLLLLGFCLIALRTNAEEYNLNHSISVALANNSSIKSKEQAVLSAENNVNSDYAGFYPQLNLVTEIERVHDESLSSGSENTYSGGLKFEQNIFNGNSDLSAVRIAKLNLEIAKLQLRQQKAEIIASVKSTFVSLNYSVKLLSYSQVLVQRRFQNLELVQLRFKSGRENRGALLLAEAYYEQAKYELEKAQNTLIICKLNLISLLSLNHKNNPVNFIVSDADLKSKFSGLSTLRSSDYLGRSFEYKVANLNTQVKKQMIETAESGYYPKINLTSSLIGTGDSLNFGSTQWSAGIQFSWNIFSGFKNTNQIKSAEATKRSSEFSLKSIEENFESSFQKSVANLGELSLEIKTNEAFERANLVRADIARVKYNNGLATFDEWDKIESDLITYQKNLLSVRKQEQEAYAEFEKQFDDGDLL